MSQRRNQVALHVSSPSITPAQVIHFQYIFDTTQEYLEIDPMPNYIHLVEDATWALGLDGESIYEKHRWEYCPAYYYKPIVILDEQTAKDGSILVVSQVLNADEEFEHAEVRMLEEKVVGAAMNLQISNQTLDEYKGAVDEDGIWRRFPSVQS